MVEQGDIVFLDFDPQTGHEQKGRRHALVVSSSSFNRITKAAIVCPITNMSRNIPLHVKLPSSMKTTGEVMCEQVKALDIVKLNAKITEHAPQDVINDVLDIIELFFKEI